jgi:hypothetical protein
MHRTASALLAAALLLTACAVTPSPSPSGAAAAYLALTAASNKATCTFNAVLSQSAPRLADLKQASADYADSLVVLSKDLSGASDIWSPATVPDVDAMVAALRDDEATALTMASAATLDDFIAADNRLIAHNAVTAAAARKLRTDLGLRSAGNPCDA